MSNDRNDSARVLSARGPLALEALLLRELAARLRERSADPTQLSRTLRIVVPSHSLRGHLAAQIARTVGPTVGLKVTTLTAFAREILARASRASPRGAALFEILVRRAAQAEPTLARELGHLDEPYSAVVATITDFFDAGFEPALAPVLLEAVDSTGARSTERERAAALVRAAERAAIELEHGGFGRTSAILAAATDALAERPALAHGEEIWIHGFLDATGRALDLLELAARTPHARIAYDRIAHALPSSTFGGRVRERLGVTTAHGESSDARPCTHLRAPDPSSEMRAIAVRVRALLDDGVAPESIAIVARDLEPWRAWIRLHMERLAIPFSAPGTAGFSDPAARRALRLSELLQRGGEIETERALDLFELAPRDRRALLLAARASGAGRSSAFADPRARALEAAHRALQRRASIGEHAAALAALCQSVLGWRDDSIGRAQVSDALDALALDVPADVELEADEFARALAHAITDAVKLPLGGEGGGVQCLSVTEARARTFPHLFVVGLNQGTFPRRVGEDPLLSDEMRAALAAVLPDLPQKRAGHDEEHVLFESLLRASAHVTLSWSDAGADGRELLPSPFVAAARESAARATAVFSGDAHGAPRPAHEWAIVAGLAGDREGFETALALALDDARHEQHVESSDGAIALARSRASALLEIDRVLGRDELGPFFGFVGSLQTGPDPRLSDPYVTTLERLAACPWQTFVQRMLRIDRLRDPLLEPGALDARLLGITVHRALERLQRAPGSLDAGLDATLLSTAREVLAREGVGPPGIAPILAAEARTRVAVALAWLALHPSDLVAVEADGSIEIACDVGSTHAHALRFRADRVERSGGDAGATITTDFKTGAPFTTAVKEETRRKHLLAAVARAQALQGAAYAHAAGTGGRGRYLYLDPELEDERRSIELEHGDAPIDAAFRAALQASFTAWHAGAFFPRLLGDDLVQEPRACELCTVSDACIRGDSGARARLRSWVLAAHADVCTGAQLPQAERAWLALWDIGRAPNEEAEEDAP